MAKTNSSNEALVLVVEHQSDAGVGLLGERLRADGIELDVTGPDTGRPIPQSLEGYDGLIVLGGNPGPLDDDEAPWLPSARSLIAEALAQDLPMLGVCLGGQLLTTVAGGRVETMPDGPEIGLKMVQFNEEAKSDELFSALNDLPERELPAVQWHYLESAQLAPSTVLLASNPACEHQAYRVGARAWGVQFHPEATATTVGEWIEKDPDELDRLGIDAEHDILHPVQANDTRLREAWTRLADRFADIVRINH